jgi:hypothetical protein
VPGIGDLLIETGHLGTHDLDQGTGSLSPDHYVGTVDDDRLGMALRVERELLQAARPGVNNSATGGRGAPTPPADGIDDEAAMACAWY